MSFVTRVWELREITSCKVSRHETRPCSTARSAVSRGSRVVPFLALSKCGRASSLLGSSRIPYLPSWQSGVALLSFLGNFYLDCLSSGPLGATGARRVCRVCRAISTYSCPRRWLVALVLLLAVCGYSLMLLGTARYASRPSFLSLCPAFTAGRPGVSRRTFLVLFLLCSCGLLWRASFARFLPGLFLVLECEYAA